MRCFTSPALRPIRIAAPIALALPLLAPGALRAEIMDNFWSGPAGAAWTNSAGECWQSQDGPSDLPPCAAAPEIIESLTIDLVNDEFDFDKANIKPEMAAALDDVAQAVKDSSGDEKLTIVGHTDGVGSQAYNLALGQRRAEATKAYLIGVGIPSTRMITESVGKLDPVASNDTEDGRAKNRRIEIRSELYTAPDTVAELDIQ